MEDANDDPAVEECDSTTALFSTDTSDDDKSKGRGDSSFDTGTSRQRARLGVLYVRGESITPQEHFSSGREDMAPFSHVEKTLPGRIEDFVAGGEPDVDAEGVVS